MIILRKACAAENFRTGRQGHDVEAVVIHLIDGSQMGCDATFASSSLSLRRSAHYSIGKNGEIHQYVDENDTAYHAGRVLNPTWTAIRTKGDGTFLNPNVYTIGIEHEGRPDDEWTDAMYSTSAGLLASIVSRHPRLATLSRGNVVGHREIFSEKSCPGNKVSLDKLISKATALIGGGAVVAPVPPGLPASLTMLRAVNVRSGGASVRFPIQTVLPVGTVRTPSGIVSGDNVNGNDRWYELTTGEFIWAGATDRP